jgi:hypothetical protein
MEGRTTASKTRQFRELIEAEQILVQPGIAGEVPRGIGLIRAAPCQHIR